MEYVNLDKDTVQCNQNFNLSINDGRLFITANKNIMVEILSNEKLFCKITLNEGESVNHVRGSNYAVVTDENVKVTLKSVDYEVKEYTCGTSIRWWLR